MPDKKHEKNGKKPHLSQADHARLSMGFAAFTEAVTEGKLSVEEAEEILYKYSPKRPPLTPKKADRSKTS